MFDKDDLIDPRQLLGLSQDQLQNKAEHRSKWFDWLVECEKLKIVCQTAAGAIYIYYTFMMPDMPIIVFEYSQTHGVANYCSLRYSCDLETKAEEIVLPISATIAEGLEDYLYQTYQYNFNVKKVHHVEGDYPYVGAFLTSVKSLSPAQIYDLFKEYYVSFDKPNLGNYLASFSETSWPELRGLNTQYIDNIGVFVPTNYKINDFMTQYARGLVEKKLPNLGGTFVCLDKASVGSPQGIAVGQNLIPAAEHIPYIGPLFSVVADSWRYANQYSEGIVWPRLFAFGRNPDVPIPTYKEMQQIANEYRKLTINDAPNRVPYAAPPQALFNDAIKQLQEAAYI